VGFVLDWGIVLTPSRFIIFNTNDAGRAVWRKDDIVVFWLELRNRQLLFYFIEIFSAPMVSTRPRALFVATAVCYGFN
jgi:hypothetical protein